MNEEIKKVMNQGQSLIEQVIFDTGAGKITWRTIEPPNPEAIRAFEGKGPTYSLLVVEANTKEAGIVQEGVITATSGDYPLIVRMPRPVAKLLYQYASQNASQKGN